MSEIDWNAPEMQKQWALLEALGTDYVNMCLVDLEHGTATVLKAVNGQMLPFSEERPQLSYEEMCRVSIEKYAAKEWAEMLAAAVQLDHVKKMLARQAEYSFIYEAVLHGKKRELQMKYLRISLPGYALMGFREVRKRGRVVERLAENAELERAIEREKEAAYDERESQKKLEQALEKEKDADEVLLCLSKIYYAIYELDLEHDTYKTIYCDDRVEHLPSGWGCASIEMDKLRKKVVLPEYQERICEIYDLQTMAARLEAEPAGSIALEYPVVDGNWHTARFIAKRRDAEGHVTHALYTLRLISDQKRKEQNWIALAEEAERANRAKTEFLRRMSHDIRTPINGIMGMIEIADRHKGDVEILRECRAKTLGAMEYLLSLVNNVLDIGKLESGELMLEHKPFNLVTLLVNQLSIVGVQAAENGVNFYGGKEYSTIKHRYLIGSPVHLNRVLMNLANNAIKYNRRGGSVTLYCKEIASDDHIVTYQFVCTDTGVGMSKEFQEHAFEAFTQEGKQSLSSYNGSGLGLSIVKKIAEQMHGTIELESKENVGTTFTVTIPFEIDWEESSRETAKEPQERQDVTGRRALLVEDNELNREIAQIILEDEGLIVDCVPDGAKAVERFAVSQPGTYDYIFMDIMMPVMDGLEATRCIRAMERPDAKTVPVIAMTANAFLDDIQQSFDAGMNDHLMKPLNFEKVRQSIQRFAKPNN